MVEIRLTRVQAKVLKALSEPKQPVRATDLTEVTEETAMTVGKSLRELERMHLAELIDKRNKLWQISDTGNEVVATLQVPVKTPAESIPPTTAPQERTTVPPIVPTEVRATVHTGERTTVPPVPEAPSVQQEGTPQQTLVPSQATILREIGERLGVSSTPKKGEGATLDAIIYWVERVADMNNLTDVWNRLTETGVPPHIIKRWVTLYAQTIPGKQIPEELKDKLEGISEKDRVITAEKGEVSPKPKRFSIVADQIIGDPEGDYDFNQAFKIWAQGKGVPTDQVNPLAIALQAMIDTSKEGPQTLAALLTSLTPLLTTPKQDNTAFFQMMQAQQTASQSQMQLLQQMLTTAIEEKHKAELEGIKAMITTGQKPAETETLKDAFTKQIDALKEALHQQQLDNERKERERLAEQFQSQITELKQLVTATAQGKSVDSKIGLLDKTLDKGAQELSGVRQDIKGFASMMIAKGEALPRPRSPQEKQRFAEGLTKGIARAEEAKKQAQELWGTP